MKRCLFLFVALAFLPVAALASGQTVVRPGEPLKITAETGLSSPKFTWIIYQEEHEVDTREGKEFAYAFPETGRYTVVLLAEEDGGRAERSTVEVLVNAEAGSLQPLRAVLDALPPASAGAQNNAPVPRDKPVAVLYAARSEGEIVEYRIDFDIAADSDGDGDPGNDRDNSESESITNGSAWGVDLKSVAKPVTVRLTVFDRQGNQSSQDLTFVEDVRGNAAKPLAARIASLPPSDATGTLHLGGETAVAVFGFSESEGQVGRYEFDRNIAIDTDGDGNPGNDVDNRLHPSLTGFEPLQVTFRRAEGVEQIVQLTVVDKNGRQGSRIRRKVAFDGPGLSTTPKPVTGGLQWKPRLWADHAQTPVGQPVSFYAMGVPKGATLSWDFNGDGTEDKAGGETTTQWIFDTPGDYTASVRVTAAGETVVATDTITVLAADGDSDGLAAPTADFSYSSSAEGFRFTNLSTPDPRLQERQLQYEWNFGDGALSTDANPTHLYQAPGIYVVSLRVTDASGKASEKAATIEAAVGAGALDGQAASPQPSTASGESTPEATTAPGDPEGGSVLLFLAKTLLYLVLLIIFIIGGYFVYLKIKDPDLSFAELFEQELNRFTGASTKAASPLHSEETKSPFASVAATPVAEATVVEDQPAEPTPEPQSPLPPWLTEQPEPAAPTPPEPQPKEPEAQPEPQPPAPPPPAFAAEAAPAAAPEPSVTSPLPTNAALPDWLREPRPEPAAPTPPEPQPKEPEAQPEPQPPAPPPPAFAAEAAPAAAPIAPAEPPAESVPAPLPPQPATEPASPFLQPLPPTLPPLAEPNSVEPASPPPAPEPLPPASPPAPPFQAPLPPAAGNEMPFPPPLAGEAELPLKPDPDEDEK